MASHERPGSAASSAARARGQRVLRVLVSLLGLFFIALGLFNLLTGSYTGHTSKLGGAEVRLHGSAAQAMGAASFCFGLLMLGVWLRRCFWVLVWCLICLAGAAASLAMALQFIKQS